MITNDEIREIEVAFASFLFGNSLGAQHIRRLLDEVKRLRAENARLGHAIAGTELALSQNREELKTLRRLYSELKGAVGECSKPPGLNPGVPQGPQVGILPAPPNLTAKLAKAREALRQVKTYVGGCSCPCSICTAIRNVVKDALE